MSALAFLKNDDYGMEKSRGKIYYLGKRYFWNAGKNLEVFLVHTCNWRLNEKIK